MANGHVPLEGSERQPLPDARRIGPVPSDQTVRVTVTVRRRSGAELPSPEELAATPLAEQHVLSRAEFAEQYGADPVDLDKAEQFAQEHGLEVLEKSPAKRTVVLQGTADAMSEAFQVELAMYARGDQEYRSREGSVHIPAELEGIVEAVVGLDAHPIARPHFRRADEGELGELISPRAAAGGFSPVEIAQLYDFPPDQDGSGETIAIIELGGGFREDDLDTYFSDIGVRRPTVTAVEIGTAQNSPSTPDSADGEVMLDIEVAGAVAPGANQVVYFANNTTRGFLGAILEAVHDDDHRPFVISISWGAPEDTGAWTTTNLHAFENAFSEAAMVGVTICVAAGDNGSTDGVDDGRQHVDFPASHPFVIACGGTRLTASNGSVTEEVVWERHGATGGGISAVFKQPAYQDSVSIDPPANPGQKPGRGVPDVAGDAAPDTGYQVRVDGEDTVIGGTSAVAPLWAGLVARLNQSLRPSIGHPVGFFNVALYHAPSGFSDITQGSNGEFHAHEGWDACTGLGRPIGTKLLEALGGPVAAHAHEGGVAS